MEKVNVGDVVDFMDESGRPGKGLVVCVHSQTCINVVYVSPDPAKSDVHGQQIERMDSLQLKSEHTAPGGRFFTVPE